MRDQLSPAHVQPESKRTDNRLSEGRSIVIDGLKRLVFLLSQLTVSLCDDLEVSDIISSITGMPLNWICP
jgi:hypothetical protein